MPSGTSPPTPQRKSTFRSRIGGAIRRSSTAFSILGFPDRGSLPSPPPIQESGLESAAREAAALSTLKVEELHSGAELLATKFRQENARGDIDEAIMLDREALKLCPTGNPKCRKCLNDLAVDLFTRYMIFREVQDVDEAIDLSRDALKLHPSGHPDRSLSLDNLAYYLHVRFTQTNRKEDEEELFALYAQMADKLLSVSSANLLVARAWADTAEDLQHPAILLAYETALRLYTHYLVILLSLSQDVAGDLKTATSSLAVDAFSACLRNGSPAKAVELLEYGRLLFFIQFSGLRSPLDDVIESGLTGKQLAHEFSRLTTSIRSTTDSPEVDQDDHVSRLNSELEKVVADIRRLPNLSQFLLPPTFSDLREAARDGPVIILNASKYSCDALIISLGQDPTHIPLQITRERVRDLSSAIHPLAVDPESTSPAFPVILGELWDRVVSPIFNHLQTTNPLLSRIWWYPTAEFSLLPLHAAHSWMGDQRALSDFYISSYTPTLSALIQARRDESAITTEGKRFVAIGPVKSTGANEFNSIVAELAIIEKYVEGLATYSNIRGSECRILRASEAFYGHEWVHLTCRSLLNWEQPFESGFTLLDGHLTIKRMIEHKLRNPQFAFLSTEQTMIGGEKDLGEGIHLAMATQFAGFRSVVGTLWGVDDEQRSKIAATFYDTMIESDRLDHTQAAYALHKTMTRLVDIPLEQRMNYIHVGV